MNEKSVSKSITYHHTFTSSTMRSLLSSCPDAPFCMVMNTAEYVILRKGETYYRIFTCPVFPLLFAPNRFLTIPAPVFTNLHDLYDLYDLVKPHPLRLDPVRRHRGPMAVNMVDPCTPNSLTLLPIGRDSDVA